MGRLSLTFAYLSLSQDGLENPRQANLTKLLAVYSGKENQKENKQAGKIGSL